MRKSCYGCYFEFKSKCYWFSLVQGKHPNLIPEDVMQKGCHKYENKGRVKEGLGKGSLILKKIIEVFDGEILGEKYKPPKKKVKAYKKKYVKSPHNYAYRRDAQ